MTNLVIDVGNSAIKLAVFENDKIIYQDKLQKLSPAQVYQIASGYQFKNIIVSSVKDKIDISEKDFNKDFNFIKFDADTAIPIINEYKSPESLGLDRLAAVIGANFLFPKQQALVIDAGTCITYDAINDKSIYKGGSISLGINMRFEAIAHYTDKLPLLKAEELFTKEFGENSEEALQSGILNGVLYEVKGFINQQLKENQNTKIILCGGDAAFFDTRFKNSIFAHLISYEPSLVLIGLNTVVKYQNDHN